jgi:hypothetical protein
MMAKQSYRMRCFRGFERQVLLDALYGKWTHGTRPTLGDRPGPDFRLISGIFRALQQRRSATRPVLRPSDSLLVCVGHGKNPEFSEGDNRTQLRLDPKRHRGTKAYRLPSFPPRQFHRNANRTSRRRPLKPESLRTFHLLWRSSKLRPSVGNCKPTIELE